VNEHEADGVDDVVAGVARGAVTGGAYLLEQDARRRAERARAEHAEVARAARPLPVERPVAPVADPVSTPEEIAGALRRRDDTDVFPAVPVQPEASADRWPPTAVLPGGPLTRPEPVRPEPVVRDAELLARIRDRADVAANAPLLRDPTPAQPGRAVLPDIGTLIPRHDPVAHTARLAGIGDRAAVSAVVLASAHQARPASQVPAVAKPAARSGQRPRPVAREPERSRGR
jgi:hypothetical protein